MNVPRIVYPGFWSFVDAYISERAWAGAGADPVPEDDCNILDRRVQRLELCDLHIQVAMIDPIDDLLSNGCLQGGKQIRAVSVFCFVDTNRYIDQIWP
jgi:hypothetical protein